MSVKHFNDTVRASIARVKSELSTTSPYPVYCSSLKLYLHSLKYGIPSLVFASLLPSKPSFLRDFESAKTFWCVSKQSVKTGSCWTAFHVENINRYESRLPVQSAPVLTLLALPFVMLFDQLSTNLCNTMHTASAIALSNKSNKETSFNNSPPIL